jgi:heparan-alpha-glucosaminide N-acetyltransferase
VTGFMGHWNLNRNAGWAFDRWLLNLFPRVQPYVGYIGGYATLNFIPTLGTMLLGLIAGTWLRERTGATRRLLVTGVSCLVVAALLHWGGICPVVKRLWTPAWVCLSGGCCFIILAAMYHAVDVKLWRRWAFPFLVIGMNSLAMYLMRHLTEEFLRDALLCHFGWLIRSWGPELQPVLTGLCSLLILWLVLLRMYRRKIFLRV